MKLRCVNCNEYKKIEDFPKVKGKKYSYCKECKRAYQRDWIKAKRQIETINKYK